MNLKEPSIHSKQLLPDWPTLLFLLVMAILAFGLFLPGLGLYWDDWAKLYVYRIQGSQTYWQYYMGDRPLSAWTHIVLTPILGVAPIGWQLFTLGMRIVSTFLVFSLLRILKPDHRSAALMAAAIFLVYPLFSQQPISVTFHQQWMQYAFLLGSFNCTLLALRSTRHRAIWTAFAVILSFLQLTITEYFLTAELIRPVLIWFSLNNQPTGKKKVFRVILSWLPYLVLLITFFIWRMFIMPQPGDSTYQTWRFFELFSHPMEFLAGVAKSIILDLGYIFVGSWSQVFETRLVEPISRTYLGILLLSFLMGAGAFLFLSRNYRDEAGETTNKNSWPQMAVMVGLTGTILGILPAWLTQSRIFFDSHSDRYALPALLGLCILVAGLIEWLGRSGLQKAAMAGLIITLGCGFHLRNSFDYQIIWDQQMRLYWQMFWRAPGLRAQTAVYSESELVPNQGLFSMSAALNHLYLQNSSDNMVDFWFYTLRPKFNQGTPASFSLSHDTTFRTLRFIGNSPDTLLIHMDHSHGNCLWVLRPEDRWNPYISEIERDMLPISNLERISPIADEGYPPEEMFGREPQHFWCKSFEKAELAWQMEDWNVIVAIGNDLLEAEYSPLGKLSNSPREWWPFIVGYARSGETRAAITLSQQSLKQDRRYQDAICQLWRNMDDLPEVGVGLSELGCMN